MQQNQNIYSQYKEQSVNTMTGGELIVLLYDEAIKRLTRAKLLAEKKDWPFFESEVQRAREIMMYLDHNLDRSVEVSGGLHRMYDYFIYTLARAKAGHKTEAIDEVMPMVAELRDTWKEADKLSRKG